MKKRRLNFPVQNLSLKKKCKWNESQKKRKFAANNITVIGVGGAGCGTVARIMKSDVCQAEFVGIDTGRNTLRLSKFPTRILLRAKRRGSFGSITALPKTAAEESLDQIKPVLQGTGVLILVAGMGGRTGTGVAPVIARVAREMGILTVAIVTKPFGFEGIEKRKAADTGIAQLVRFADSVLIVSNERLKEVSVVRTTHSKLFKISDKTMMRAVRSICGLFSDAFFVGIDGYKATKLLMNAECGSIGIGDGTGENKARTAAEMALHSSLNDVSLLTENGVLLFFTVSEDTTLEDVSNSVRVIAEAFHPDTEILYGVAFEETLCDEMQITLAVTRRSFG